MSNDLTDLPNVGPARADDLRAAGFDTTAGVRDADSEALTAISGIGDELASAIQNEEPNLKGAGETHKLDEYRDDLIEAAHIPQTKEGIARDAGITYRGLQNYLSESPEFAAAFRRARGRAEDALIMASMGDRGPLNTLIEDSDANLEIDDKMVQWLLSRSFGYVETERKEVDANHKHAGEGGGPIEVQINETVVGTDWSDE